MKEKMTVKQITIIVLCAICWAGILNTAWLFSSHYTLAQTALSLSDGIMGNLMFAIGLVSAIGYFFSGIITDLLGPKPTMDIGIIITVVGAILLFMNPSEGTATLSNYIMIGGGSFFYITGTLRYIPAISTKGTQGRAMGYFYAIMGLVSLIEGNIFASITDSYGAPIGLSALLLISVISMVITQIIAHILDKDTPYLPKNRSVDEANRFKFSKVGALLINPRFIALCVIGFCTVSCTTLTTYTQPLLASQFGLSAGTVTRIGTFCNQGTILVFASLTGVIVDKVGSAIKLFLIALGLLIVACIMVLVVPWSSPFVFIVVIAMVLIKTGDAVGKPGRQLLIPECGLSDSIRGTAIGFLNVIMALPSMLGKLFGSVLTAYSGERMGYQIIYFIFIGIAAVGIIGVLVFQASKKKANAKAAA